MTAILLPTTPAPAAATPQFNSWGSDVDPPLGGPSQHISRLGSRHGVTVDLPPLSPAPAMAWIQRLKRSKDSGDPARMAYPLLGIAQAGGDGIAISTSVSGGTSLAVAGGTASAAVKEGQWLSILRGGKHYLYSVDADVTLNGSGAATLTLTPMLRTPVTAGTDTVFLTTPMIEGRVDGDPMKWSLPLVRLVGLSFTIIERE